MPQPPWQCLSGDWASVGDPPSSQVLQGFESDHLQGLLFHATTTRTTATASPITSYWLKSSMLISCQPNPQSCTFEIEGLSPFKIKILPTSFTTIIIIIQRHHHHHCWNRVAAAVIIKNPPSSFNCQLASSTTVSKKVVLMRILVIISMIMVILKIKIMMLTLMYYHQKSA